MIRPRHFGFNAETAKNNAFQQTETKLSPSEISSRAREEFDLFVDKLRAKRVEIDVIEDTETPGSFDAVFPNNWISMHEDGAVITYPMYSPLRRLERREDILEFLEDKYQVARRYSFEFSEDDEMYLEGTGSMVLDRANAVVYACLSPRTHLELLQRFSVLRGMQLVAFKATHAGSLIYHTNVLMALGQQFALCCLDAVESEEGRKKLTASFVNTGKEIIEISREQMGAFAGNMLQLLTVNGEALIVMSTQACQSLSQNQLVRLEKHGEILHSSLDVIEYFGGGSARCMMAENFLFFRPPA